MADPNRPPSLAYVAALAVAVFAFLLRLLSLRSLPNDHFLYLSAAQQILLGEIPARDFVEPGMLLQFLISAAGQAIAPGPATEALITGGFLAIAAAATCVGVSWLTRSVIAGAGAALFQVLLYPRLYAFPKILVPAGLLVLALVYARVRRTWALVLLAIWIAAAFLLRNDIGAYAAVAAAAAVALSQGSVKDAVKATAALTLAVLLVLLPYFIFLEWTSGIAGHVRDAFEYGKAEAAGFSYAWPAITFDADGRSRSMLPWSRDDAAALLFYIAYTLPVLSSALLLRAEHRRNPVTRAAVGGAVVIAVCYIAIILRHPVLSRVQDLASIFAILGGWTAAALMAATVTSSSGVRLAARGVLAVAIAAAAISVSVLVELPDELDEARLFQPPSALRDHAREVIALGTTYPWSYWPSGSPPDAVAYLNACTSPSDRLWLSWPAPEWYFFTRRGFGAGHANTLSPHSYRSAADQALMIERLEHNHPPIVLVNESTRAEFAKAYPRLNEYVDRQYAKAAEFTIYDGSTIAIATRRGLVPGSRWGAGQWPCHMRASG